MDLEIRWAYGDQTAATCLIDQTQICDTQVDCDS